MLYAEKGNFTIIGLVYYYGSSPGHPPCSQVRPVDGLLPVMSLKHAIHTMNSSPQVKANQFKLGLYIWDVCDKERFQETVVKFFLKTKFFGVIGTNNADDFTLLGVAMNLYFKPVWSLNEVPLDIDSHPRFKNLFWIAPEILHMAHAVIDFASRMDWDYIGLIHQNNMFGWRFDAQLKLIARNHSVCFSKTLKIDSGTEPIVLNQLIMEFIITTQQSPVIIVALQEPELLHLLQALKLLPKPLTNNLQLVALTTWGTKQFVVHGNEELARGVITFQPLYNEDETLTTFFRSKNFTNDKKFVENYTQTVLNTTCSGEYNNCLVDLFGNPEHSTAAAFSDSVYAFTRVILDSYEDNKTSQILNQTSVGLRYVINKLIALRERKNVAPFRKDILKFQQSRRIEPAFGIYNYQEIFSDTNQPKRYRYVKIGHWRYSGTHTVQHNRGIDFKMNLSRIQWQPEGRRNVTPSSKCGEPCKENEIITKDARFGVCCWFCVSCGINEIVKNNTCVKCKLDEKLSTDLRKCEKLQHRRGQVPIGLSVFIYTLMAAAFLLTFIGLAMFIRYKDTHVIRALSRELSTIIFIGLLLWNSVAFFTLFKITRILCFLRSTFLYLGYSMVYAPLLLKTNRIYRIFQNGKTNPRPPKAVSPLSQVLITLCLCSVQIMVCLIRVTNLEIQQLLNEDTIIDYCEDDLIVFFINMVYILAIMAATTFYAFKTRHFPKNYNESKYIGFAMYATIFVSCLGLVTFFSVSDRGYKTAILSLVCLVCSLTVFLCLFPKRFILIINGNHGSKTIKKPDSRPARHRNNSENMTSHTELGNNDSLRIPPEISPNNVGPPSDSWDIRRFSRISMLSIIKIQRNDEMK